MAIWLKCTVIVGGFGVLVFGTLSLVRWDASSKLAEKTACITGGGVVTEYHGGFTNWSCGNRTKFATP